MLRYYRIFGNISHNFYKPTLYLYFTKNKELYSYLVPEGKLEKAIKDIIHLGKALCIFRLNEIDSPYLKSEKDIAQFQYFVEEFYNFWRHTSRYSLVSTRTSMGLQLANFIEADQRFNQSIVILT